MLEIVAGLGTVRVFGPYVHRTGKDIGRRHVGVVIDGKTYRMFLSRWLMMKKLGRFLERTEEVDHRDEDRTNDSIENLQILTRQQNAAKLGLRKRLENPAKTVVLICPTCKSEFTLLAHRFRYKQKRGCEGPFCGKKCAAIVHWSSDHPPKPRKGTCPR